MHLHQRRRPINTKKPKVLKARDIPSVAQYMNSEGCTNVMLLLGAGVSTSAGIPDFRSPETGLYSNLARLNLPHPEAVFEIDFFRRNPVPFYTLAHELYPGKFRPTITHSFIRLLAEKKLLHTCFTQNIDTLERRAGVPGEKIIEAHGSFASQRCIDCKKTYDDAKMKDHIERKAIAKCEECGGYVKPDIVFFGEGLPPSFGQAVPNLRKADLLIVMGTSLTVHPFASLAGMVDDSCPRVLVNLDHVGDFGARADDVILIGKCDDIVKDLCKELGWEEDLVRLWNETEATVLTGPQLEIPEVEPVPPPETDVRRQPLSQIAALEAVEARFAKLSMNPAQEKVNGPTPDKETSHPLSAEARDVSSPAEAAGSNQPRQQITALEDDEAHWPKLPTNRGQEKAGQPRPGKDTSSAEPTSSASRAAKVAQEASSATLDHSSSKVIVAQKEVHAEAKASV